jgi:hypothetical protein
LRGSFVVGHDGKGKSRLPSGGGLASVIGPLLKIVTTAAAARGLRQAAVDARNRLLLALAAGLGGAVALFCFSRAALTLLENRMDPAEAWAVLGGFYGVMGGVLYFAASRRRVRRAT